ncbi:hypothetical protein BFJ70_g16643 [Fusarium oxysporum]|nr:hypothetical protein BFJ70_g16643 [Fusarium oxysporum]
MSSSWEAEMGYYPEPARIDLRVVMPNHDDYLLHHIPLRSSDQGVDAMLKLTRALKASRGRLANWLMKVVPLLAPVVYTATLYPMPIEAISQDLPCAVNIETECRCHILTKALQNPGEFPNRGDFLASYSRFTAFDEAPGTTRARDVLLVRLELNKLILLAFVVLFIILSIICGVVAGICRESLDTGLGVFGAVIGVIGIVAGVLTS